MVRGRISWSLVPWEDFEIQKNQESSCSYPPLRRLISHVTWSLTAHRVDERRDHRWY